jgi:hypothetical protein
VPLRDTYNRLLMPILFMTANVCNPSKDEQVKKTHVGCHLFVMIWMELSLSEISQAQKDKYFMFSLTCGS